MTKSIFILERWARFGCDVPAYSILVGQFHFAVRTTDLPVDMLLPHVTVKFSATSIRLDHGGAYIGDTDGAFQRRTARARLSSAGMS